MKTFLKALALSFMLVVPAVAADKGGPPAKIDALGQLRPQFTGCFVGAGAGGVAITSNGGGATAALLGLEVGCDLTRSNVVFGVKAGYDFGESEARFATAGVRAGILVNPSTLLYMPLNLTMDGRSPKLDNSILSTGVGVEFSAFSPSLTLLIEATKDIKGFGDAADIGDAWTFRVGARHRF